MTASPSTGLESPPSAPEVESHDLSSTAAPESGVRLEAGRPSPFARLGAWAATHFRRVLVAWLLVIARLRILRRPRRERTRRCRVASLRQPVRCGTGHHREGLLGAGCHRLCRSSSSTTTARSRRTHRPRPSWPRRPTCSGAILGCPPSLRLRPGSRSPETAGPPSSPQDQLRTPTRWCRPPTPWSRSWRLSPRPASP